MLGKIFKAAGLSDSGDLILWVGICRCVECHLKVFSTLLYSLAEIRQTEDIPVVVMTEEGSWARVWT